MALPKTVTTDLMFSVISAYTGKLRVFFMGTATTQPEELAL